MRQSITIILLLTSTLYSCRFSKPILTFNHKSFEKTDSVNLTIVKIQSYRYPRISWLYGPHFTGSYVVNSVYDKDNRLTRRIFSRNSNSSISDGNLKTITKIFYFSDSAKAIRIEYMIDKNHGPGRMPVFRKTLVWDNDKQKYIKEDSGN